MLTNHRKCTLIKILSGGQRLVKQDFLYLIESPINVFRGVDRNGDSEALQAIKRHKNSGRV